MANARKALPSPMSAPEWLAAAMPPGVVSPPFNTTSLRPASGEGLRRGCEQGDVDVLHVCADGQIVVVVAEGGQEVLHTDLQLAACRHAEPETDALLHRPGVENPHQSAALGHESQRPATRPELQADRAGQHD